MLVIVDHFLLSLSSSKNGMGRILSENLSATYTQGVMGFIKSIIEEALGCVSFKEKNCRPYKSVKCVHVMKEE